MKSRLLKAILLGVLTGIVGLAVSLFDFSRNMEENIGLGLLFTLRGVRQAPSDVVVVSIDKASSEHLNVPDNPDKWPRSLHARVVDTLAAQGATVVSFDVHFIEPRSPEDDILFVRAVRKAGNVVLAEPLTAREVPSGDAEGSQASEHSIVKIIKPFAPLAQSAVATAPFVLPRIPFKVNQYWTFQTGAGDSPTFPVVAFQLFTKRVYGEFVRLLETVSPHQSGKLPRDAEAAIQANGIVRLIRDIRDIFESEPSLAGSMLKALERRDPPSSIDEKRKRLLTSLITLYGGSNRWYANYYGPPRTITTIPYYRALQLGERADGGTIDMKGKAVFVGLSEKLLAERKDSFYTVFSQANGVFIGGVEIAATAFANMLEDSPVKPVGFYVHILILVAGGILVGMLCRMSASVVVSAAGVVGLGAVYFVNAAYQFNASGTWYPIVIPLFVQAPLGYFGAVVWNYVETNKERQHIRKALAYYVPDEVVDQLAKNILDMKQGGQTVYGACLFADVAGYTTLSEKLDPQQLRDLMHKYFEATFEPIKKHGGLVVNLKGDSFLAIWKAARAEAGLRRQACLAALDVAKAVHQFNRSIENLNLPTRVGVHSGQIFLGNIGAGDHYEYGPTGDTVNTASRMDGLNKYLGTEILISGEVIDQLDGFLTREVGTFRLKGKAQPIVAYELLCRMEESDEKQQRACATFIEAFSAFRRQSWDEAKEKFHQSIEYSGQDGPPQFYIKLCEQYKTNPPEEPWEGVVPLEEK